MLKEAIEHIQNTTKMPEVQQIDGRQYIFTTNNHYLIQKATPITLTVTSLSGVVEYLNDEDSKGLLVHIEDYQNVFICSRLDENYRSRETHLHACCNPGSFRYGQFMALEEFIIGIMSCFDQDENTKMILEFIGSVKTDDELQVDDNGVSQKATVKSGITTLKLESVPNPVKLRPYVTFPEIYQPSRQFVFRMKNPGPGNILCALFKTDSEEWKSNCVDSIRSYLSREITDAKIIS